VIAYVYPRIWRELLIRTIACFAFVLTGEAGDEHQQESDGDGDSAAEHLSDASDLSFDSADERDDVRDGVQHCAGGVAGLGMSNAAVHAAPRGASSPGKIADPNAPTQSEKDAVRELLQRAHEYAQLSAKPTVALNITNSGLDRSDEFLPGGSSPRKTVGMVAGEVLALGYAEHTGRWRGFPYDTWSCCDTSELHCPKPDKLRLGSTSTGSSPRKLRNSLDSTSGGSLYAAPKAVPFRPASASPKASDKGYFQEVRPYEALPRSRTPSPRKSATTTPLRSSPRTPSPSKLALQKPTGKPVTKGAARSTDLNASRSMAQAPRVSQVHARSPAVGTARPAQRASDRSALTSNHTHVPVKPRSSATNSGSARQTAASAVPTPAQLASHATRTRDLSPAPAPKAKVQNEVTAPYMANVESDLTPVTEVAAAATNEPSSTGEGSAPAAGTADEIPEFTAPATEELVDAASEQHAEERAARRDFHTREGKIDIASVDLLPKAVETDAEAELPAPALSAPPVEAPAVPSSPGATSAPKVKVREATPERVSHPVYSESMKSPPIKMTFSVRVPPSTVQAVPAESAELFGRLYAPVPVVEAHRAKLYPHKLHSTSELQDSPRLEESADVSQLATRATQELLQDRWEQEDVPTGTGANTAAFDRTLESLRSEIDTARRSTNHQDNYCTEYFERESQRLDAAQASLQEATQYTSAHTVQESSFSGFSGLEVTGHAVSKFDFPTSAASPSYSFHVNPLDAMFPTHKERGRSPRRRQLSTRSHSAPSTGTRYRGQSHLSNSDSFFSSKPPAVRAYPSGAVRSSNSATKVASTPSYHPATGGANDSMVTGASPAAGRRKSGVWLPSSPLHAISFHRAPHWKPRSTVTQPASNDLQGQRRARSLSPSTRFKAPLSAKRDAGQRHTAKRGVPSRTKQVPSRGTHATRHRVASPSYLFDGEQEAKDVDAGPALHPASIPPTYSYGSLPPGLNPHLNSYDTLFTEPPLAAPTAPPVLPLATMPTPLLPVPATVTQNPVAVFTAPPYAPFGSVSPSYVTGGVRSPKLPTSGYNASSLLPAGQWWPPQQQAVMYVPIPGSGGGPYAGYPEVGPVMRTATSGVADNNAWWEHIQAQKRQHEALAYEAELQRTHT
jgi:hypothetical protein